MEGLTRRDITRMMKYLRSGGESINSLKWKGANGALLNLCHQRDSEEALIEANEREDLIDKLREVGTLLKIIENAKNPQIEDDISEY